MAKNIKEKIQGIMGKLKESRNPKKSCLDDTSRYERDIKSIKYIKIPDTDILISEGQIFSWLNYPDAHYKLSKNGLFMPTPDLFMPYFKNAIDAYNGKIRLHDGSGTLVSGQRLHNLYTRLTGECWVWLNSGFRQGKGFMDLDLETVVGVQEAINGKETELKLITIREPLEACLDNDYCADLNFNKQGFAITQSKIQGCIQGENIHFYKPKADCVTRFGANSAGAFLSCCVPQPDKYAMPAVFACKKINA